MKAIALVKQVPDVRASPVGVRPDGTIDRRSASTITNPPDLHAVEAALQLASDVTALSMGPVHAESTLREAVSLGADRGVLLCDRSLAGSDTWATANALAAAIETLGGADLVVCGTSALDGETGQVGPSVASRLGWPQATGCESVEVSEGHLIARRVVEGGYETLSMPLPALVTVAETGFLPRYPTAIGRRRAATAEIARLSVHDIGIDATRVGLAASPTKVAQMTPAPLPERSCRIVGSDGFGYEELAAELLNLGALGPTAGGATTDVAITAASSRADPDSGEPAVWVVTDADGGQLQPVSKELLTKAAMLASELDGTVAAVVLGNGNGNEILEAGAFGADVVYSASDAALTPYRAEPHARVLVDLAQVQRPEVVLFGATTTGRDLAPRVASLLNTGLAADCTDLVVGAFERRGVRYDRLLHQVRPAMGGGILATCVCPEARPQMATVRPGVFAASPNPKRPHVEPVAVALDRADLRVEVVSREIGSSRYALADADVVIAGGAGCNASTWHLVEGLAGTIGGRVAASRGAVEAGLAPRDLQVGQTGTSVHPQLYVACGISGALHHTVGMRGARTIVALNRDPDALIFRLANFGIVADIDEALPQLTAAIQAAQAEGP